MYEFRKLYADVLCSDGTLCVVYLWCVNLLGRWYGRSGVELYGPEGTRTVHVGGDIVPVDRTHFDATRIVVSLPKGQLVLQYEPEKEGFSPPLSSVCPSLSWSVLVPRARAWLSSTDVGDWEGLGYVDWVTLSRPTRFLRFRELMWGRAHLANSTVVFTSLELANGRAWRAGALWATPSRVPVAVSDIAMGLDSTGSGQVKIDSANLMLRSERVLHAGDAFGPDRVSKPLDRLVVRAIGGPTSEMRWLGTAGLVPLPVVGSFQIGVGLAICGAVIMIGGMVTLSVYGHGLPMSPYPPSRYVTEGIYGFMPHPIYSGFSILCVGTAMAAKSSSGLWLVSPTVILSCVAWVLGFERDGLRKRFGSLTSKPFIHLPKDEASAPALADWVSVHVLIFFPWLILYEAVRIIGVPPDANTAFFSFEMNLPVYEWTEAFYISTYPFVVLAPLASKKMLDLRKFSICGLIGTGIIIPLFLVVPLVAPPRPFTPASFLGNLLALERVMDTPAAAFPSFHVFWALLAASLYAEAVPSWRIFWWGWTCIIVISCITTGMHALADVLGGGAVFLFVMHLEKIWKRILLIVQSIANSWKEWRFGSVRFINHGIYAGTGSFLGLFLVGILLGPAYFVPMIIVAMSAVITSALWAQFIEGSSVLLRPYGYYGGVLGVVLGSVIAKGVGADVWLLLAAFSVAGPWIQAFGRLRCLVQGCCHGRETSSEIGICYFHPRSRVTQIAGLRGIPIHPTPLYSILWNIIVGLILARLWSLHAYPTLIGGLYLILTGLGRFVEENYRGEPQTPILWGLRLYQWLAVSAVIAGAVVTTVDYRLAVSSPMFNWRTVMLAAFFGILNFFAFGADFPDSNRRFSRLAQ